MRKYFGKKGGAMILVMVVMVIVLMMSTLLISVATIGAKRSKREFALTEDRIVVQKIGRDFVAEGISLDTTAYSEDYDYEIDAVEYTLTVKRKEGSTLLEVKIDSTTGDLVSWREYYR